MNILKKVNIKIITYSAINLSILFVISTYLGSCKKCDDEPSITTFKVTRNLPYKHGDKRIFSYLSSFDTFTFVFNSEYYMRSPGSRDAACPTYEDYQYLDYTFTNTKGNPQIKYLLFADLPEVNTELNTKKTTLKGNGLFFRPWPPVDKITINGINYDSVGYLIVDTFNYIVYKPYVGILRIKTTSGTWDLVP
jgi:hypothetical protein